MRWVEHLTEMDSMRQGIGWVGSAQRNPLVEYKRSGFEMFKELIARIDERIVHSIYHARIVKKDERPREREAVPVGARTTGRNDPCPCGSGKKYKKCCGK